MALDSEPEESAGEEGEQEDPAELSLEGAKRKSRSKLQPQAPPSCKSRTYSLISGEQALTCEAGTFKRADLPPPEHTGAQDSALTTRQIPTLSTNQSRVVLPHQESVIPVPTMQSMDGRMSSVSKGRTVLNSSKSFRDMASTRLPTFQPLRQYASSVAQGNPATALAASANTAAEAVPEHSKPCVACNNRHGPHKPGYCPLKLAGVEFCNLCGCAHYGQKGVRNCPALNDEEFIREMLSLLKRSPEDPALIAKAKKFLTNLKADIVQKKKLAAEKSLLAGRRRVENDDRSVAVGETIARTGEILLNRYPIERRMRAPVAYSMTPTTRGQRHGGSSGDHTRQDALIPGKVSQIVSAERQTNPGATSYSVGRESQATGDYSRTPVAQAQSRGGTTGALIGGNAPGRGYRHGMPAALNAATTRSPVIVIDVDDNDVEDLSMLGAGAPARQDKGKERNREEEHTAVYR
jgi:hypothetical protein